MSDSIAAIQTQIQKLPFHEQKEIMDLLDKYEDARKREVSHKDFLAFVKEVWPAFIEGRHHKVMAEAFERVADGKLKRLIINMPPRHTNREIARYLFTARKILRNY